MLFSNLLCSHVCALPPHAGTEEAGGCPFSTFFATCPQDLIAGGLFKQLAVEWNPNEFRPVSVALVALSLGAEEPSALSSRAKMRRQLNAAFGVVVAALLSCWRWLTQYCTGCDASSSSSSERKAVARRKVSAALLASLGRRKARPAAGAENSTTAPSIVRSKTDGGEESVIKTLGRGLATRHEPRQTARQTASSVVVVRQLQLRQTPLGYGMEVGADGVVASVRAGSQAARAGVQAGERIVSVDGTRVDGGATGGGATPGQPLDARELLKASVTGATVALGVASSAAAGGAKTHGVGHDDDEEPAAASVYQQAATSVQRIVRGNAARYRAAKEQAAVAIQSVAPFLHATPRQLTSLSRIALASQADLLEESLKRTRAELEQRDGGGTAALDEATEFAARFCRERSPGWRTKNNTGGPLLGDLHVFSTACSNGLRGFAPAAMCRIWQRS